MNLQRERKRVIAELRATRTRIKEIDQALTSVQNTPMTLEEAQAAAEDLVNQLHESFDTVKFAGALAGGDHQQAARCLKPGLDRNDGEGPGTLIAEMLFAGLCWLHPQVMKSRLVEELRREPDRFGSVPGGSRDAHANSLFDERSQYLKDEDRLIREARNLDVDPDSMAEVEAAE
ncbi:MAG: hypothetical protein RJQ08_03910 [Salinisphaeraceae bacterium]|uniref:hypothetical protein n=1 Tax=Algiphilus sp. TaxID=1872431 RepID=UPI0032ECFEA8